MVVLVMTVVLVSMAQQPRQVDDAALADVRKNVGEWIAYNGSWMEQRYSPLNQINETNVSRLGLAFSMDIPAATGNPQNRHEGTPLVFEGVLYSITPWSVVYAVDARTGKELWHSYPAVNQQVWGSRICCGVVNRGIALYQGKVIAPVVDGRLRALDAKDGKVVWEVRVSPETMPYTITMAPRVIKGGRVIVGVSGGEYNIRGFFSAYDAETGKMAWRFYTVPGDPAKGFEDEAQAAAAKTWSGEWWKIGGGGGVWGGIAYDPDVDLVYVSTGQPAPWSSVWRGAGDNLYTDSIIAVRGATGKYVWHYQEVPGDDWDLDSIADLMLADLTIDGKPRKVIMHAPKDGFFYVLDRRTGELLSADPWVSVSWAAGVNMKTGRAIVNPEARYQIGAPVNVMPGPGGGHVWPPMSFNPATGLVYIPSQFGGYSHQATPTFTPVPLDIGPTGRGQMNTGNGAPRGGGGGAAPAPAAPGIDIVNVGPNAARGAGATPLPPPPAAAVGATAPGGGAGGRGRGGAGGGGNAGGAPAAPPQPSRMLFLTLDGGPIAPPPPPAAAPAPGGAGGGGGGRGAGGGGGGNRGAAGAVPPPVIGPAGRGSILIAWDPVAQKERWRGPDNSASGFNAGGTLSTGGNLVFGIGGGGRLVAYRADTGAVLAEFTLPLNQPGPPMTYMIDGKQYIVVSGGPGGGGRGGRGQ